uniref:Uncharacterized protein n=1 Tax=mine drainage metagenome TaxID=410659 RepID=E6Q8U5_9ZZZZ
MEHEARKAQLREAQQRLADKRRADGLFKLSVWVTQEQAERVRELLVMDRRQVDPPAALVSDPEI